MENTYPAVVLCRVLEVSRSAYYQWLVKRKTNQANPSTQTGMEALIIATFQEHRRRYGVRRLVAERKAQGVAVGKHRVRTVLQHNGLKAIQPRSFVPRTTQSRHPYPISPDLLLAHAGVTRPNEVWVTSPVFR